MSLPLVRRHLTLVLTIAACSIAFTTVLFAQRRFGGMPAAAKPFAANGKYDGRFRFARIKYDCFGNCFYYNGMPSGSPRVAAGSPLLR